MRYALGDRRIKTHGDDDHWIAPTAVVVGDVTLGRDASIWWNAVVRGDTDPIVIGDNTNIQDNAVLHADPGFPLTIGKDVTVGHCAVVHGCTVEDGCLIGINSVILNGARIGAGSVVGAGAVVAEGKEFPPYSLIVGVPGKAIRTLTPDQAASFRQAASHYVANAKRFKAELKADD
jgi:carbonic anhydrase/acetyltransferase-like protein (isoleucine patch superfamily)